jgi:predicted permease
VQTATGLFGNRSEIVTFLAALMGVVGLVLLLTCANVANLALARAAGRRQEMAVRVALGAKNQRLFQQVLVESVIVALLGGCAAIALASAGTGLLARLSLPGGIAVNPADLAPDARVLAFTGLVSLVASILFGLAPALNATRLEAGGQLRTSLTRWAGHDRLRYLLVAGQVALCVVLVSAAGLFARSLARALSIDPGFRTDHVAMATAYPDLTRLDSASAARYLDEALLRLKARPGIRGAAWTTLVPLVGEENVLGFKVPGYVARPDENLSSEAHFVGPDFFSTLNVPVVEGRAFRIEDRGNAAPVVIVSESFAKRYWPGRSPVGQAMAFDSVPATVVGMVPDVRWRGLVGEAPPMFYLPIAQRAGGSGDTELTLIALTESGPAAVLPEIRETLRAVSPDVPVGELGTFEQAYASLLAPQRTGVTLLGSFSALALLLAVVGIGGVVAHGVAQRRREIGIRIALGAGSGAVQRLAVRSSLRAVGLGLAAGGVLALVATRTIATFLYGVSPADLVTFAGTAVLLAVAAGVAAWLPARRATTVDPLVALRAE